MYSGFVQIYASTPEDTIAAITLPIDRQGMSILDDWDGFGRRLTGTGTTRLLDVRVEPDEVVGLGGRADLELAPGIHGGLPAALPPGGDGRHPARRPG